MDELEEVQHNQRLFLVACAYRKFAINNKSLTVEDNLIRNLEELRREVI